MRLRFSLIALFIVASLTAQQGTFSPYSYFGIGDLSPRALIENRAMAGISMLGDSIHMNLQNPAALGNLKLTTYAVVGNRRSTSLNSSIEQANATKVDNGQITNLDYLALAFPFSPKGAFSFGLMPLSAVNYKISQTRLGASRDTIRNIFEGSGGLNRVFASAGHQLIRGVNVGAMAHYNWGTKQYRRLQSTDGVQFGTFDQRNSRLKGLDVSAALTATVPINLENKKWQLHSSVVHDFAYGLDSGNEQNLGSFLVTSGGDRESFSIDLGALQNSVVEIPSRTVFGLGLSDPFHWFIGAEYATQDRSTFRNEFIEPTNSTYEQASVVSVGGYYIPKYNALNGIFNRITYRAGLRFEDTGLRVNGTPIEVFSATTGFSIPMGSTASDRFSSINVALEYGTRGTLENSLLKESFFGINVGLSLNDRWFIKRRIN